MSRNDDDGTDPLLAALRLLPSRPLDTGRAADVRREARAAYLDGFATNPRRRAWRALLGRAAVPVFLAGIVGLYLTWAIGAATALMQ